MARLGVLRALGAGFALAGALLVLSASDGSAAGHREIARQALDSLELDARRALAGAGERALVEGLVSAREQLAAGEPCAAARTITAAREKAKGEASPGLLGDLAEAGAEAVAAAGAGACGIPAPALAVDHNIQPVQIDLRAPDGALRPLARLVGASGAVTDFVANELIVTTDSTEELNGILARWNGRLLETVRGTTPDTHLIRVNPSAAESAAPAGDALVSNLRAVTPTATGNHKVSSELGLQLLAAMVQENADGHVVGLNAVSVPASFVNGSQEHPDSPDDTYDPDAGTWSYMKSGGAQDIGVLAAWRAMEFAGIEFPDHADPHPSVAVIDGGYIEDQDWHEGTYVPDGEGWYPDDPYHGVGVAQAVGAVADNGYGTAGSAGPIGDLMLIQHDGTTWGSVDAVTEAWIHGADIINMSYTSSVDAAFFAAFIPFENATADARAAGNLVFAAAGNQGIDVDAETCVVFVCWEEQWIAPCENAGVICVGGLAENSKGRHAKSNYGHESCGQAPCSVDIFGPMTVWAGATPDDGAGNAHTEPWKVSGTSVASPFVAGVAKLIWAAGAPGADEVENLLYSTAHSSNDWKVVRYVNAYDPVKQLLGNIAPTISITKPADTSVPFGGLNIVHFEAYARDYEDGDPCCTISWSSDVDGHLGYGTAIDVTFTSPGTRVVTASVTDSDGATSTAEITMNIGNTPPSVQIGPLPGDGTLYINVPYVFSGSGQDPNEPLLSLPCSSLEWFATKPGAQTVTGTGCNPTMTLRSSGVWSILLIGTDDEGWSAKDTATVTVVNPPKHSPPAVSIKKPGQDAYLLPGKTHTLDAIAVDPDACVFLTCSANGMKYLWKVRLANGTEKVIGHQKLISWKPQDDVPQGCGTKPVDLIFKATDAEGMSATDTVDVTIGFPPC